jgi:hypothetical protein
MSDEAKRKCPFCAEAVQATAKLCPHCRQWLRIGSFHHPLVGLFVFGLPLCAVFILLGAVLLVKLDRLMNPKPYYSEFPNAIRVVDSRLNWVQRHDGLYIYLTGILTNQSPVGWHGLEFDCRFFDSDGVLVDAATRGGGTTVGANDDSAFRVSLVPASPTNRYVSYQISVNNARNAKGLF